MSLRSVLAFQRAIRFSDLRKRVTRDGFTSVTDAFRQRLATERVPKKPARRKRKPKPPSVLVREPDYDDTYILTPALVAELFAVSPRTVRRWANSGALPSFRTVGGRRRFRWAELTAWLGRGDT